jgi:hypothetical protein
MIICDMPAVYSCLLQSLQRTSSDARERLMYCAEAELRKSVLLFDPLPSQLAYPDILEKVSGAASPKDGNTAASRLLAKGVKGVAVIDSDTKSMGDRCALFLFMLCEPFQGFHIPIISLQLIF